jgi:hypothetical protein
MPEEYRCSGLEYIFEGKVVSYWLLCYIFGILHSIFLQTSLWWFRVQTAKQAEHTATVQAVNI